KKIMNNWKQLLKAGLKDMGENALRGYDYNI
ncbi:hypothetical protein EVA_07353, partial [gut metagenome]